MQAPEGLYWEGRFNGGFFALRVWGAFIWRGLYRYMKGLFSEFYGIIKTNRLSNRSYIISLSAKKLLSLQGSTNCYDLVEQYTLKLCSHGTPDKL